MRKIAESVYLAAYTSVTGDVWIGPDSTVLHGAAIRGDEARIEIGNETNIQENCTVHVDAGHPVKIGSRVTVGHNTVLHGCTIEDETLIGMGSIIMNGASVGKHCIIGAGTLITGNTVIPEGSLVLGSPGSVKRSLSEDEIESILASSEAYVEVNRRMK